MEKGVSPVPWKLARVEEVSPSNDSLVWKAKLKMHKSKEGDPEVGERF